MVSSFSSFRGALREPGIGAARGAGFRVRAEEVRPGMTTYSQKKSRRFRRLLKLITGRRQTEWTGATRCPNKDDLSHIRESLIDRKRGVLFRHYLPCRPLAELFTPSLRGEVGLHRQMQSG